MTENAKNYEFAGFRLDTARRCLWHDGELVSLTPKAIETLFVLIQNSGEIVDKGVLLDEVWADTFVEESTLSQNILTIRKALASFNGDTKFIDTVPRRGYRFVAPVTTTSGTNGHKNGHAAAIDTAPFSSKASSRWSSVTLTSMGIAGGIVFLAVIAAVWYFSRPHPMAETKFREFRVADLLSDANIKAAAISPDGKYLALTEAHPDSEKLTVRQLNGSNSLELAAINQGRIAGAVFAPDSQHLYLTQFHPTTKGRLGELYRVPVLGGPSQMLASDVDSLPSISVAGNIAFARRRPDSNDTAIILTDADGKNERVVATRPADEGFLNATISPDGRLIASAVNSNSSLARPMELVLTDTATGAQSSATEQTWLWIGQTSWLPDGSGLAVVGYGETSPDLTDEVWLVSVPSGKARMLENGVNGAFGVSVTNDGGSIVAVKSDKITSLLVANIDNLANASTITTKAGDRSLLPLGAEWTANDTILYSTTANGNADIWSMGADGSNRRQLTADKFADFGARMSSDGKFVYFLSNRYGLTSVWRSASDGSDAKRLTGDADVFSLSVAPDGRAIYYAVRANSIFAQHLWRAASDGSVPVELTSKATVLSRISPDGKTIACYFPADGGQLVLTLLDSTTGAVIRQFPGRRNDNQIEWLRDGTALLTISQEGADAVLWKQPVGGGPAVKLYSWPNEFVFRMALSPQGNRVFFEKGVSANHVIMLSDRPVS